MASYTDIQRESAPFMKVPFVIRYKGTWDMQDLYESCVDWFRNRKYHFQEKIYKHKHPSPFGAERQYIWTAEQKIDEWEKVVIDMYIHTYDAHDIEGMGKDGVKKILTKGKIWITLKLRLHWDHMESWDKNSFWAQLKKIYMNYIIRKKQMRGYHPRYRGELTILYNFIQRKLNTEFTEIEYQHLHGVHKRGP